MALVRGLFIAFILVSIASAETSNIAIPEGKTADYYRILLKNPRPGHLFDRFCDSWQEQYDLKELETLLKERGDASTDLLLAFYYERVHEPAKAAALYDKVIQAEPGWPDVCYYKASVDMERGLYAEASSALQALLEKDIDVELQLKTLKLLGRSLLREGKKKEGLAAWERLLEVAGMDADVAEDLLDLQLAEGLYAEALADCDRIIDQTTDAYRKVMLLLRRASLLVRMDRRTDAVDGLRTAFGLTGQGSWMQRDVLSRIEYLYRGADDLTGLCECHEAMLEEWPDNPALLQAYVGALLACGRQNKALENARALVRLVPDRQDIKEWYVDQLLELGRSEEAASLLGDFLKHFPDDNTLRLKLADVYHRAGDDELTVKWILAYLEHSGKREEDYLNTARTLTRYGLDAQATSVLLDMLNRWPNSATGREAVALHMSRKSYLQLELAWKHYEWLAKDCDLDTLLRLGAALNAANSPQRAYTLLESRQDDFKRDYRYLSMLFEATSVLDKTNECLEIGLDRIDLAQSTQEMDIAVAALVYQLRRLGRAAEWIDRLSKESGLSTGRLWLLASLFITEMQPERANEVLSTALEQNPSDTDLLECRLMLAKEQHDWEQAETTLKLLIQGNPGRQATWIRELVPVLLKSNKTEDALKWIDLWKKVSPNAVRPYELERDALVAANRMDDAVERMRYATRRFNDSKELKLALGRLYEQSGRMLEAEQLYWRVLNAEETLDGRMNFLSDIIRVDQRRGGMDDLIAQLEHRAENSRTAAFPLLGLAECYRVSNRMNERNDALERVLELRPNDVTVLRAKAELEEDLGNYDAARDLLVRIADTDKSGSAFCKLAEYEFLYGNTRQAAEMLMDPRISADAGKYVDVVAGVLQHGCVGPLLETLKSRAQVEMEDYRVPYLYAVALGKNGQEREAARILVTLIDWTNERPGEGIKGVGIRTPAMPVMQRTAAQQQAAYMQREYGDVLSADLIQMFQLIAMDGILRNYARQGLPNRAGLPVPDDLAELKQYALLQMRSVMATLPEDERRQLVDRIKDQFPYAALMMIDPWLETGDSAWWDEAWKYYPESEELRLMQLLTAANTINSEASVREAVSDLSDNHPELARQVLSSNIHKYPDLVDLLPLVAENMLESDEDVIQLVQWFCSIATTGMRDEETNQGLSDFLDVLQARCSKVDDIREDVKLSLSAARVLLQKDYANAVAIYQASFYQTNASAVSSIPAFAIYNRHYSPSMPPQFPPLSLLDSNVEAIRGLKQQGVLDAEKLQALIMELPGDSLFRWLALAELGASEEVLEDARHAIEAKPKLTRDERFALACWYRERDPIKGIAYIRELQDECRDPGQQDLLDRGLLQTIGMLDHIPVELQETLKGFAERMVPSVGSDQSARMLLIDLMERLNMPLDTLVSTKALAVSPGVGLPTTMHRSLSRPPDVYQQVREMLERGDTDTALLQVAMLVRKEALRQIYLSTINSQQNYQFSNCMNYIRGRRLDGQLMTLMQPSENERQPRRIFEYGFACETTGRHEDALDAFRKTCEARPDWSGARMHLCVELALVDLDEARSNLSAMQKDGIYPMVAMLQQRMNNSSVSYEDRLALCDLMVEWFGSTEHMDENALLQTGQMLRQMLMNRWYENNRPQLPGLFDPVEAGILATDWPQPEDRSGQLSYLNDSFLMGLQQRRRELYVHLLKNMSLSSSRWAWDSFETLTGYLDFTGMAMDSEDLLGIAEHALHYAIGVNRYYSNERGNKISPLEFYITELTRRDRWGDAEKLLAQMSPDSFAYDLLQRTIRIHEADTDEAYLALVADALKVQTGFADAILQAVYRMHQLDGRTIDLDDLVWREVVAKGKRVQWNEGGRLIRAMVQAKLDAGDQKEVAAIFRRLFDECFTEEEKHTIQAAEPGTIYYANHQTIYNKYQQITSALYGIDLPVEAFPDILQQLAVYDGKMQFANLSLNLVNQHLYGAVDIAWIKAMGFLGDWDSFDFYEQGRQASIFMQLVSNLSGERGNNVSKYIDTMQQQTFGSGLIATMLSNKSWDTRMEEVVNYLAGYSVQIAADSAKQERLFIWLQTMENHYRQSVDLADIETESGRDFVARYVTWEKRSASQQLDRLDQMKISEMIRDIYNNQRRWGDAIMVLQESEPDRAMEAFHHMRRLVKLAFAVQGSPNPPDDRSLFGQSFNRPKYTESEVRFISRVVREVDTEGARQWYRESYVSQLMNQTFNRFQRMQRSQETDYRGAMLAAGQACLKLMLNEADLVDLNPIQQCVARMDGSSMVQLAEWLATQDFPESDLKRLLCIYLQPGDGDEVWLKTFFADEGRSVKMRLDAYAWLSSRGDVTLGFLNQPEWLFGMADLLDADLELKIPVHLYRTLVGYVRGMEAGDEKLKQAERVLKLWDGQRISTSQSDASILYTLSDLAFSVGDTDRALACLQIGDLPRYPRTYAVALRYGLDAFVQKQLPTTIKDLQNDYPESEIWIPPIAVATCEAIAQSVSDQDMRLALRIFFARLPVKSETEFTVNEGRLDRLLAEADETMIDPELMQWIITQYNSGETADRIRQLKLRYARQADPIQLLSRNHRYEIDAYADYIARLAKDKDIDALRDIIGTLWGTLDQNTLRSHSRSWLMNALFQRALSQPRDEEWIAAFFTKEDWPSVFQLEACAWLSSRGNAKPTFMNRPEFILGMVDLLERDQRSKLPGQVYQAVIREVEAMDDGAEKLRWVDKLMELWHGRRVDAANTNVTYLFALAELCADAGKSEAAIGFLMTGDLSLYPKSYALALRIGLNEFIVEQLPNKFLLLKNDFPDSDMWITTDAISRYEKIAADVKDQQLGLVIRLFFARMPNKVGDSYVVDWNRVNEALLPVDQTVNDPALMLWVIGHFNGRETSSRIEQLKMRFVRQADLVDILKRNNSDEIKLFASYVEQLVRDRQLDRLREIITTMWERHDETALRNDAQNKMVRGLFQQALSSSPEEAEFWANAIFTDARWPAKFQLDCYAWLSRQGGRKPRIMDDPHFIFDLIDLMDEEVEYKLSRQAYQIAVNAVEGMQTGDQKRQWADRLATLWQDHRVDLSQTDMDLVHELADLCAAVGRDATAIECLKVEDLLLYPRTYALALRHGWNDFVMQELPKNLLNLKNNYPMAEVWVSPETANRFDAMVEKVEDEQMRLAIRLFFARLPIKTNDAIIEDTQTLNRLLMQAGETLVDPEIKKWVASHFSDGTDDDRLKSSESHDIKQQDLMEIQSVTVHQDGAN